MKQLILITGFLGAGKTTFVNQFFHLFPDEKTAVIVNEYGKVGIDGTLLSQKGYHVEEISQGSIFCVCRTDRFMEVLVEAAGSDASVILVETSGLSNPTNIGDILAQIKQVSGVEFDYRGCITLIDAKNFHKVLFTAVAVPDQIRQASLVAINKVDLVSADEIEALKREILQLNQDCRIVCTVQARIEKEVLLHMRPLDKGVQGTKEDITSATLTIPGDQFHSLEELQALLEEIKKYIYRCKGYAVIQQKNYFLDGTMEHIEVTEVSQALSDKIVFLYHSSNPVKRIIKQRYSIV